jgi:hypothetical protein
MSTMSDYKITDQDVEGVVNYLRFFHPENANENFARELLEYWKATSHRLALTNPEALNDLYESFQQSKNKR